MTDPILVEAPSLIGVGAQTIVNRAKQLGIQWNLRPCTSTAASTTSSTVSAVFDGDTQAINMVNLTGREIMPGFRLMVLIVPPSGNYVIGHLGTPTPGLAIYNDAATAGSTAVTFYQDMPGSPQVTLTKLYSTSLLRVDLHVTASASVVLNSARFAVNLQGPTLSADVDIAGFFWNAATEHHQVSGTRLIAPSPEPGLFTVTLRWRRAVGAGTISQDGNDWNSFAVSEVFQE